MRPSISRRNVGALEVVSLFGYSMIEPLLLSKHTAVGHRVYRFFGRRFVAPFVHEYAQRASVPFGLINVDDHVRAGYAHTAVLTESIRHSDIQRMHGVLLASHHVSYAGKTLRYRLEHPRGFRYTGSWSGDVVLVDDTITTGITLQEAQYQLNAAGVNVLFALTLADAQR